MASILSKLCTSRCVMTHDGLQAVDAVKTHPPGYFKAIFMDIHMLECDGITAMKMIRQRENEVPPPEGDLKPCSHFVPTPSVCPRCVHILDHVQSPQQEPRVSLRTCFHFTLE